MGNVRHKTIKSILKVAVSNIISLLSGVFVGFILPKIIGVTDYGYYKTFSLYISYVGMFHFGIEDGIYLLYGGKDFSELDEEKFRFYTLFLIILEAVIGIVIGAISCIWLSSEMRFIFIFVAIYLFTINIGNYYQFISQITERFTELTIVGIIRSCLTILSIAVMWVLSRHTKFVVDYKIYIVCVVVISCLILVSYMFIYRKLTFGKHISWSEGVKDIKFFMKSGFPLMVANLSSSLILTIDRQFVNIYFDTDTYAIYAFAYNMLSLITTATSAVSIVIFPVMKKLDEESLTNSYCNFIAIILIFVSGCLLVYFPLIPFINWFLPQYVASLDIFRIILPGLVGSSAITIIMHNYYKTLGYNLRFFIISLSVLILSAIADITVYYIFKSTIAISIASIFVIVIWYLAVEFFFIRKYKVKWIRNFAFMLLSILLFYGVTAIPNNYIGFAAYFVIFIALTYGLYFKEINAFIKKRKARKTLQNIDCSESIDCSDEDRTTIDDNLSEDNKNEIDSHDLK